MRLKFKPNTDPSFSILVIAALCTFLSACNYEGDVCLGPNLIFFNSQNRPTFHSKLMYQRSFDKTIIDTLKYNITKIDSGMLKRINECGEYSERLVGYYSDDLNGSTLSLGVNAHGNPLINLEINHGIDSITVWQVSYGGYEWNDPQASGGNFSGVITYHPDSGITQIKSVDGLKYKLIR